MNEFERYGITQPCGEQVCLPGTFRGKCPYRMKSGNSTDPDGKRKAYYCDQKIMMARVLTETTNILINGIYDILEAGTIVEKGESAINDIMRQVRSVMEVPVGSVSYDVMNEFERYGITQPCGEQVCLPGTFRGKCPYRMKSGNSTDPDGKRKAYYCDQKIMMARVLTETTNILINGIYDILEAGTIVEKGESAINDIMRQVRSVMEVPVGSVSYPTFDSFITYPIF